MINFNNIQKSIIKKLDTELPSYLTYHNSAHTLRVIEQAEIIAKAENSKESDIELLKLAALFHDTGFINTYKEHEEESCIIAETELKKLGVNNDAIQKIKKMIMATKIPQSPKSKLEMILADADLEYLGTNLFFEISDALFNELSYVNKNLDKKKWNKIQYQFLTSHCYFTAFCIDTKESIKIRNLHLLDI